MICKSRAIEIFSVQALRDYSLLSESFRDFRIMGKKSDAASSKGKGEVKKESNLLKKTGGNTLTKGGASVKGKKELNKKSLDSLGKVSLAEKLRKVAETVDNDEDAAAALKQQLTPVQNSQIWNQHKQHLLLNPKEAASFDTLSKKEKGNAAALWFVKKKQTKIHAHTNASRLQPDHDKGGQVDVSKRS